MLTNSPVSSFCVGTCAAYVLNRLLDGFEGKLTSSKWAKLAKCSQDTASRDIVDLMEKGILVRGSAGGRSTSYDLADFSRNRIA